MRAPTSPEYFRTRDILGELKLHTVCQEACCPNIGECFSHRTATFMLMGDVCTRNCPYCAVAHGKTRPLDPDEPRRVAEAVARLDLQHVVVTSVDRDDLRDGGAAHFAATARAIKAIRRRRASRCWCPTSRALRQRRDGGARADRCLQPQHRDRAEPIQGGAARRPIRSIAGGAPPRQETARGLGRELLTKAGVMLGLGEERGELATVIRDLRAVECDILTLGQYLRPSAEHIPVARYVPPAEFAEIKIEALALGFRHVESGPLVRSSYHAWEHVNSPNDPVNTRRENANRSRLRLREVRSWPRLVRGEAGESRVKRGAAGEVQRAQSRRRQLV